MFFLVANSNNISVCHIQNMSGEQCFVTWPNNQAFRMFDKAFSTVWTGHSTCPIVWRLSKIIEIFATVLSAFLILRWSTNNKASVRYVNRCCCSLLRSIAQSLTVEIESDDFSLPAITELLPSRIWTSQGVYFFSQAYHDFCSTCLLI